MTAARIWASGPGTWADGRGGSPTRVDFAFRGIVGKSFAIRAAVDYARKLARSGLTGILLVGETGTGKSLFARAVHYASRQADEPFVVVNCGAVPAPILESELFGHEPHAFTGANARKRGLIELAESGTLLLDDVGRLPAILQPKVLRAVEEHRARRVGGREEFDIRCNFVATTSQALEEHVAEGSFREDLFYRLNALRISLPPLRERDGDVVLLARHFLDELAQEQGLEAKGMADEVVEALKVHDWPGNVRELKSVMLRAALVCGGTQIFAKHLSIQNRKAHALEVRPPAGEISIPATGKSLEEIEAEALRLTLELTGGNQSAAARVLEISRPTLVRKARKYGLEAALRRRVAV